jgi:SAM-dependent methyltransferase
MNATCFLCGGTRYRLLSECARFGAPGRFWLCEGCGLIHQDPEYSANWSRERYEGEYFKTNAPQAPADLHRQRRHEGEERARWLERYVREKSPRVLEVGSAEGAFLAAGKARGWTMSAVEPDPAMAIHSREVLGVETHTGGWEDYAPLSPFDIVASFHVIEHLPDPAAFVARLKEWLKPGGLLYLETPDNLHPWTHRAKWFDWFDAGHVVTFHEAALVALVEGAGFGDAGRDLTSDAAIRVACRKDDPHRSSPSMAGAADRIEAAFGAFRRHHWWKRGFQRAGRKLRRLLRG